jgi:hypothetical protein
MALVRPQSAENNFEMFMLKSLVFHEHAAGPLAVFTM